MTDTYLRVVLNQVAAFVGAVVLFTLLGMLGQLAMKTGVSSALLRSLGPTLVGSLVVSVFFGFALAPLGLLDALIIRPIWGARASLGGLFAAEYIVLILYRCAIQYQGIVVGSQIDRFTLAKRL